MKRWTIQALGTFACATALAGCELAGDIFKAGVWVGVLLVIGVVGLIIWLISKAVG
jgi:hypothetical protein